ncbi:MAG: hypothetical protein CSA05_02285 [Bacteroidia bacterium]|nr:MAG: hypothetical protein CSA05_02285 [Bacteroidia bacterium]
MIKFTLRALLLILISGIFTISEQTYAQGGPEAPAGTTGEDLKIWLKQNYYEGKHIKLEYRPAREKMYAFIDNHDGKITCVYSGFQINWTHGDVNISPISNLGINCEHTIPQSFFDKAEPMKSDLHHLFPARKGWNSTRSNYPFAEIPDNDVSDPNFFTIKWMYLDNESSTEPTTNKDAYSEYTPNFFEPREDHKGNVARAIFYFYTMYPSYNINRVVDDIATLLEWHRKDPVDDAERARNAAIHTYQGTYNPYISHPEFVEQVWGSGKPDPVLSIASSETAITISWADLTEETSYEIYRSSDGINYTLLATKAANTTEYVDNTPQEGLTYSYYAKAIYSGGESHESNVVSGQLGSGGNTGGGSVTELFFSEYVEGKDNNKAIEIANFTGEAVDLSAYTVKQSYNGAGWGKIKSGDDPRYSLQLSGTLQSGDVYVIAHAQANADILGKADLTLQYATQGNGTPGCNVVSFTGNDALGLFKNGTLIDAIGVPNEKPSNYWKVANKKGTQDHTLIRKSTVAKGNTDWASSAGTTTDNSEWEIKPKDNSDDLGQHTCNSSSTPPGEKKEQTITFAPLADKHANDAPFDLEATASSGLPVTFQSSDPTIASINGATVTLHKKGVVTITATQAGDDTWKPAEAVLKELEVFAAQQTITFAPLENKTFGDADFTLTATTNAPGLQITYTSSNPEVATITGSTVKIVGIGNTTITAKQEGNDEWSPAEDEQTLKVNPPTGSELAFVIKKSDKSLVASTSIDSTENVTDEKQTFKFAGKVLDIKLTSPPAAGEELILAIPYDENLPEETVNILGVSTIPPIPLSNYPLIALFVVIGVFVFIKFRR